ncbi:MAG: fibronectin type III-like domain-contianing protein, partial [Lentisphaeria bacterium]|nr:fibronectin type III-like domain-contianing protein [Lentisphaeria bacterium]
YSSDAQLPHFENYSMDNRTYRFFKDKPLYEFGFGLSYTSFGYKNLKVAKGTSDKKFVTVAVDVTNTGKVKGDEVVQVYIKDLEHSVRAPQKQLCAFERISLAPGATKTVSLTINKEQLMLFNDQGKAFFETGDFEIQVGRSSKDIKLKTTLLLN